MFETDDNSDNMIVDFSFRQNEKQMHFRQAYSYDAAWTDILQDFVGFLGTSYGYSIADQVEFKTWRMAVEDNMDDDVTEGGTTDE